MKYNKQFHLFDNEITETEARPAMTAEMHLDRMADGVAEVLTKNGVDRRDFNKMIPRILASSLRKNSPNYKIVVKKVKEKMKGVISQ